MRVSPDLVAFLTPIVFSLAAFLTAAAFNSAGRQPAGPSSSAKGVFSLPDKSAEPAAPTAPDCETATQFHEDEFYSICLDVCLTDAWGIERLRRHTDRPYREPRVLISDVADGTCSCFNGFRVWTRTGWNLVPARTHRALPQEMPDEE